MQWFDVLFLIMLFGVQPVYGAVSYKKYLDQTARGTAPELIDVYGGTMLLQQLALLVLALTWLFTDRSYALLGMVLPDLQGLLIGIGVIVLALGLLVYAFRVARRLDNKSKAVQVRSLGNLVHFLPKTNLELHVGYRLSVTAGVVEEIFYRGFVIWCLSFYMPVWLALLVSSVAFGVAHAYQGLGGVLKTGGLGLVLAIVFVITGTIWVPVILHALIDILQLATARELFRLSEDDDSNRPPTSQSDAAIGSTEG